MEGKCKTTTIFLPFTAAVVFGWYI